MLAQLCGVHTSDECGVCVAVHDMVVLSQN